MTKAVSRTHGYVPSSPNPPIRHAPRGEAVTDIPAGLPKVTLAKDGKPSIDMNSQGDVDQLVVQTLIKGEGKEVQESDTVRAHYTGWLLDGTQFDSSWDRGEPSDFSLDGVIDGWQQGLTGQTVGSQVLLIVPPDLGYGDAGSGDTIPGRRHAGVRGRYPGGLLTPGCALLRIIR